jgi:DNA-binding protein H-NS
LQFPQSWVKIKNAARHLFHKSIARRVTPLLLFTFYRERFMAVDLKSLNHTQLTELISKAQARQSELHKEKVGKRREKVLAMIKAEGYSFEDIFSGGTRGAAKQRGGTGSVAPKYRNPADPEQTWSGRGKRPRWFNDALKAGKREKDLAI